MSNTAGAVHRMRLATGAGPAVPFSRFAKGHAKGHVRAW
jgi:hypothetical protein